MAEKESIEVTELYGVEYWDYDDHGTAGVMFVDEEVAQDHANDLNDAINEELWEVVTYGISGHRPTKVKRYSQRVDMTLSQGIITPKVFSMIEDNVWDYEMAAATRNSPAFQEDKIICNISDYDRDRRINGAVIPETIVSANVMGYDRDRVEQKILELMGSIRENLESRKS